MDIKGLLVTRGEIILVAIVALVCAYMLFAVWSDPDSRPKADEADIQTQFNAIKTASSREAPKPLPRQPANSLQAMRKRLDGVIATPALSQWLGRHPNIREEPPIDGDKFLYIYQILAPSMEVDAKVGSFDVSVSLPAALPVTDPRVGGGVDFSMERDVPGGQPVVNSARIVAVEVQQRQGGEGKPWVAAQEIGPGGIVLADEGEMINKTVNQVQSGQDYQYRARMIVAATGHAEGTGVERSVVLYKGALKSTPDWSTFMTKFADLESSGGGLAAALPKAPAGVLLQANEQAYGGPWGDIVTVEAPRDFRLGLKSVSDFNGKISARIWLRKIMRDLDGVGIGWTEAGQDFVIEEGEQLGGKVIVDGPDGLKQQVDLSTDLVLKGIEKDVPRVLYYKVRKGRDDAGDPLLEVEAYERNVDVAVLKDESTGKEIRLLQLQSIRWRPNDIIFPQYPGEPPYQERTGLEQDDPTEYQSPRAPKDLTVPEPIWHEKDDPLLKRRYPFAQTNQRYLEFADGRLVYYDHINRKVLVVDTSSEVVGDDPVDDGRPVDDLDMNIDAPMDGDDQGVPLVE